MNVQLPEREYAVVSCSGEKLLVVERHREGLHIRLLRGSGRKPNTFWPAWAHELLCKADAKYQLKIEVQKDGVRVTSPVPLAVWYWPVYNLLATITRVPDPPMWRVWRNEEVRWRVAEDADLSDIIASIKLPTEVTRHYKLSGGSGGVYLALRGTSKKRDRLFTPSQVARMVELRVAMACRDGYPKQPRLIGLGRKFQSEEVVELGWARTGRLRPIKTIELPNTIFPNPRKERLLATPSGVRHYVWTLCR